VPAGPKPTRRSLPDGEAFTVTGETRPHMPMKGRCRPYDSSMWFTGDAPRTDAEATFLGRIRAPGWQWSSLGLTPENTSVLAVIVPLLVIVDVRCLPKGLNQLEVGYWPPDRTEPNLQAERSDGYLLDNGGHSDELSVGGMTVDPRTAADLAAQWLRDQLSRPVARDDWLARSGRVVASTWRLPDNGRVLAREGSWSRRTFRRVGRVTTVSAPDR
jgi:hypothetical protein